MFLTLKHFPVKTEMKDFHWHLKINLAGMPPDRISIL